MNEAEDVCGCLACAALCGVCCVAAAEEDKRERERAAAECAYQLKSPMVQVNPVAVCSPTMEKVKADLARAKGYSSKKKPAGRPRPPPSY
ncbi:TPA: hypothetical protein N0F65_006499 [Lagenidium giganteum]|uniref:Secreted protein n=1 Tax=Lagenidium giganteum TaxID=4803 RepID=A0AAV2YRN5_9STRA|nr:TPA: hypothetical protein N0F65_006499 [Lagenidium giganteum]